LKETKNAFVIFEMLGYPFQERLIWLISYKMNPLMREKEKLKNFLICLKQKLKDS